MNPIILRAVGFFWMVSFLPSSGNQEGEITANGIAARVGQVIITHNDLRVAAHKAIVAYLKENEEIPGVEELKKGVDKIMTATLTGMIEDEVLKQHLAKLPPKEGDRWLGWFNKRPEPERSGILKRLVEEFPKGALPLNPAGKKKENAGGED